MGINFNKVGDDYVAYGKRGPVFEDGQEVEQQSYQPAVQQPVVKKAEEDPEKGLKVQTDPNEDPVAAYERKAKELLTQSEQTLKNLGIEPKQDVTKLHHTNPMADAKRPETEEEYKAAYRRMKLNGQTDMTEEEIDKAAKLQVKNDERKSEFESTHTFLDKEEYKKAEAEKDAYYKQLRKDGVSKKEAKAKAYEKYGENKYLSNGGWFGIGKSSARKYIERNQDLFYENGKFSEEKLDDYVLKQAQRGQNEGEEVNYRYSLKERREATAHSKAEDRKTTVNQQGKVAKAAGMSTEKNNTGLYRAAALGAGAAVGAGVGALIGTPLAIGTITKNACGELCYSLTKIPAAAVGAGVGSAAGLIPFKDKGEKVEHIQAIKQQVPPVQVPPEQPVVPPAEVPPEQPVQPEPCFEDAYCDSIDTIKSGDNWSKRILAGKGVTINGTKLGYDSKESRALLNAYIHAEKLQYGITDMTLNSFIPQYRKDENGNKVANHFRYYTNFDNLLNNEDIMKKHPELELLRNAEIVPDCDAVTKACKSGSPKKPYHSAGIPTDHKVPCK